jgi:heme/copper-type cytochrome/quinol oxidase subunit 3
MDASQHFARSSLDAGQRPEDVVQALIVSGWPPDAAWHLVKTVQPPKQPDPRLWMVIVSFALGLVFVLVDVIMFFSLFAEPGGPRGVLAQFTDGALPVGVWVAATLPLWVVSAALIITHAVLSRREPKGRRQGRTLAVLSWILVIGNPILAVVTAVITVLVFGALGIMCGEAVSADCGM